MPLEKEVVLLIVCHRGYVIKVDSLINIHISQVWPAQSHALGERGRIIRLYHQGYGTKVD